MLMQCGILLQMQLYVPPFKSFIFNPNITSDSSLTLIFPLSPSLSLTQGLTLPQIDHNSASNPIIEPWKKRSTYNALTVGVNGVLCIQWQDLFSFWSFCGTLQHLLLCVLSERWARAGERACLDYIPLSAFSHLLEAQIHEQFFCLPVAELKCFHFSLTPFLAFGLFFTALSNYFLIPYSVLILSLLFLPCYLPFLFLLCLPTFAFLCYTDGGVSFFLLLCNTVRKSIVSFIFLLACVSWINRKSSQEHERLEYGAYSTA